ncbi:MAG: ParB/RepB/Spo0J family partition protein [bacterium]|nr:ParB/RepB/Spo0J family partition protein [bacterium]
MATIDRQTPRREEYTSEIGQVRRIPRTKIRRFADQPRTYFDGRDMNDLAASIEEIGQQTPIVVKAITGDLKHDYELVDGERRWIACGMVGVEMMLSWVKTVANTEEQFVSSVVGNFGRSGHTALEIAQAIDRIRKSKRLQELSSGEQVARIAKIFARSEPWVYQHLAILRLHPDVQAMMAPTLPEERRLSNAMGVYISSLHHDLQKEIATVVLEKSMSLNQARSYARQVAENAGLKAGTGKRDSTDEYRILENFVRKTKQGVEILLEPSNHQKLLRRNPRDLAVMASALEQCVTLLSQLKTALLTPVDSLAPQVESPKPIPPSPITISTVVDIRSPRAKGKDSVIAETPEKQDLAVSHRVLLQLFYSGGFRRVDLSCVKLRNNLGSDGADLQNIVRNALNAAKGRWRVAPQGNEQEQKFIRLVSKLRHDFGDPTKFDDFLRNAEREDKSHDPVSL